MKKTNFTCAGFGMTVKGLKKKMENGEVTFENSVQRGLSWDLERKSFLIDSILQGYPIPDMYAQRGENGVYDMLDGKQRSNAIVDFIDGKYALTGMSENMEEYEGLTFDQLEEEDKDTILDRNISIKYLDGATKEEIREVFFRLNNGKPLTNFERVKAKCKSIETARNIIESSPVFDEEKTGKAMSVDKKLELVYKSWAMLYAENPSLERKELNPIIINTEITDDQVDEMHSVFNYFYECLKYLVTSENEENQKVNQKVYKRLITPTHFLSILPFVRRAIQENRGISAFTVWLKGFYNGTRRASSNDVYNDNASRGSARADSIKKRTECLARSYDVKFMV